MNTLARVTAEAEAAQSHLAELAAAAAPPAPPANDPPPAPPAADPPPAPPQPQAAPVNYDQMMARMQQQLDSATGRLTSLDEENRRLRAEIAQKPTPPAPPPAKLVTEKDIEEYGADLIGLIGRVIKQEIGTQLSDLSTKQAQFEGRLGNTLQRVEQVQSTTQATVQERYEQQLNTLVPGWQEVNNEPGFLDWLENVDKLSGKSYMDLLQSAHRSADAQRVAHIFALYKPELSKAPAGANPPAPPQPQPSSHIDPASLAAPPTMPSAPAPSAPPPGRIWTQAEVDKMYSDHDKGKMDDKTFQTQEAEYMKALREGRVVAQP